MEPHVAIRNDIPRRRSFVPPHRWIGQRSCLVGPFANETVAKQFEHYAIHCSGITTSRRAIQKLGDGWYIAVPRDPT